MEIVRSIEAMANAIGWRRSNRQIGLVSTMGNLHDGHIALIKACLDEADISVVSVYVDPLQFEDDETFARYPRDLEADARRLEELGVDFLFAPRDGEMFPSGTRDLTTVRLPRLAVELQGAENPRLFNAKATVWLKMFNIVHPEIVYQGEKDLQELVLIKRMIEELNLTLKLTSLPIVRDENNVALSAGLAQLTNDERRIAPILFQTLNDVAFAIRNGAKNFSKLEQTARVALRGGGFETEYIAVREASTLAVPTDKTANFRVLAAVQLGLARLTDNVGVEL
ncbi:MAG: pantoate--beta-alanine ligase [Gammaproteobacteria bacterium]|nr:pantoate--beta-alanine ligase [Gammaproteobacteria bacterium]